MKARIRTVKPELFQHGALYDAEAAAGLPLRLAFAGLWCMADREGRFEWRPRELKLNVLPYDDVDFSRVLDALATRGFLAKYASAGREYGWIPGFTRHQSINNKEEQSRLPAPPDDVVTAYQNGTSQRVTDACATRPEREPDAPRSRARGTGTGTGTGTERRQLPAGASRRGGEQPNRPTWLTPYWDAWVSAYGGKPSVGPLAKALKPLHDEHGLDKTLAHFGNYLASTQATYVSLPKFAATFGSWAKPHTNGKRDSRDELPGETADAYLARQAGGAHA